MGGQFSPSPPVFNYSRNLVVCCAHVFARKRLPVQQHLDVDRKQKSTQFHSVIFQQSLQPHITYQWAFTAREPAVCFFS